MYEEIFDKIREECRIRNHSENSIKQYVYHASCFLKWVGDKPLEELTLSDAREYILYKRNTSCSPATCNGINSALSFFYRIILKKLWIYDEVPRMIADWSLPAVCSREEIEKLIDTATNIRNKAIIALTYSSGLRVGEVCRLAPTDIYMSTMQIHVRDSKNHGDHWTVLSERALELLKEYWYSYPVPRDILFVTLRNPHRPLKTGGVEIMLKKIAKEAGITAHPHTLRHSFATHLIEDETKPEYVQAMLGHRSPHSTTIYVHVSNKSLMGVKSPLDKPKAKKSRSRKSGGRKDG
ncbi:MAG: site-specific integrase [Lachnospiraceae bacterium]|nr:site-specific integrase [Clostridia bacterium]MBR1450535.1 site-specific integrase [Lachnospiraceae bacterium]